MPTALASICREKAQRLAQTRDRWGLGLGWAAPSGCQKQFGKLDPTWKLHPFLLGDVVVQQCSVNSRKPTQGNFAGCWRLLVWSSHVLKPLSEGLVPCLLPRTHGQGSSHPSHANVALSTLKCEASWSETLEDDKEMLSVFLHWGSVNENIIKIHSGEWQPTTDFLHQLLKGCRDPREPKRHSAKQKAPYQVLG